MNDDAMERMLAQAAENPNAAECDAAIARAEAALLKDLRPARRLASPMTLALLFLAVFAAVAFLFAARLGLGGIHALSAAQRANIFPLLLAAAGFAALGLTREMRPASGRHLGAAALAVCLAGFPLLFLANFRSLGMAHFVREGWPCLKAGVMVAIPAGLIAALILRRGFVLSWKMAGLAAGTFAGLTGLAMLELHCPNLNVLHIVVWHVAVVATSAAMGLATGWAADAIRRRAASKRLHS
jgi:hypothetical protein